MKNDSCQKNKQTKPPERQIKANGKSRSRFNAFAGHSERGTDVKPYQNILLYEATNDNVHTRIFIPLESLDWSIHGDHVYYASIRVENSAGLSSVMTSLPYRHMVQIPSTGVVLDLEREAAEDTSAYFGVSH